MTTTVKQGKKTQKTVQTQKKAASKEDPLADKKALINSLRGSLSWVDYSVDEYLREKKEEVKRENGR